MEQRIRNCMDRDVKILNGIVEIDETFIGGWKKNGQGGKGKPIVMGMIQRRGKIVAKVIPNRTINTLHKIIEKNVMAGSTVMTDELPAYKSLRKKYVHKFVNHSKKEYVRGNVHTNTIDGCWSHLKKMLEGTYHWVSKKHLVKYVNEFVFRHNTRDYSGSDRFHYFFENIKHRLKYKELIARKRFYYYVTS